MRTREEALCVARVLKLVFRCAKLFGVSLAVLGTIVIFSGYYPEPVQMVMRWIFGMLLIGLSYVVVKILDIIKMLEGERAEKSGESFEDYMVNHINDDK